MLPDKFPVEYQMDSQDCGPASLKIIARHFGKFYSLQFLRDRCGITKEGVSLLDLSTGAESIGLRTLAIKCNMDDVVNNVPLPAIVFWKDSHFVVVYHTDKKHIWVSDPAKGRIKYSHEEFKKGWYQKTETQGVLLAVEPTADFKDSKSRKEQRRNSFYSVLKYFTPYKHNFWLIFVIMLIVTALQGILPFISKAVIDVGIKTSDVNFINMVLIGNISILISVMIFNVLRDWLLLHITARVNIALISDYLIKLMKLPVTFFENKLLGDILQRAQDHERIRSFIMNNSLALIFSTLTFVVFSIILSVYNAVIFYIFISGSILYAGWVLLFLNIRKKLDWEYFELLSRNQSYWVETVAAIQDIKIYNYEKHRRWKWEDIQARLYHVNKRVLAITNAQNLGAQFIESIKDMGIAFFCAMAVNAINLRQWRDMCGVVMQDGKIFSDTILNNIVLDDEHIDYDWLREVCQTAQIEDEINAMPKGFETSIGENGRGLSGGQKQRLLIARALYRNPGYLFLDEATNSLDTINEKKIVEALNNAFQQRTVVVIAHRLSTIRHADRIIVLDKGLIVEIGDHETLMEKRGRYFEMVSSQKML